jgi:hypothetical protein
MTTSDAPAAVPVAQALADKAFGFLTAAAVEAAIIGFAISLKLSGPVNPWESFAVVCLGGLGCANPVLLMASGGLIAAPRTRSWGFGLLTGTLLGIVVLAVLIYIGFTKGFAFEAATA